MISEAVGDLFQLLMPCVKQRGIRSFFKGLIYHFTGPQSCSAASFCRLFLVPREAERVLGPYLFYKWGLSVLDVVFNF